MSHIPFRERLQQANPILGDGAMGTLLHQHGVPISTCFDELNLTHPEQVERIHRAYLEAGAELIETNTFGANRYKLAKHGLESQVAEINRAGAELAKRFEGNLRGRRGRSPPERADSSGELLVYARAVADVAPFRAIRYASPTPGVTAPPYDVLTPKLRDELTWALERIEAVLVADLRASM